MLESVLYVNKISMRTHTPLVYFNLCLFRIKKWEGISMDFVIGFSKTQGKDIVFVVVDRLIKYTHFFPIAVTITIPQLAYLYFKEAFRLHGLPKTIFHDRDSKFMSNFW